MATVKVRRNFQHYSHGALARSLAHHLEIVAAAHRVCPYSNATRGNIDVTLTANGQPVA